jgi:hypothetical protein
MDDFGKKIDELVYKTTYGPDGVYTLWEKKLELWIKPKPPWCPMELWIKIVGLVLVQIDRAI